MERNMLSGISLPTWTSCQYGVLAKKVSSGQKNLVTLYQQKYLYRPVPRSFSDELSIGEPQDSTFTSYLAAKAEIEDALASIGRRKKGALPAIARIKFVTSGTRNANLRPV